MKYECSKCNDTGLIEIWEDDRYYTIKCECQIGLTDY